MRTVDPQRLVIQITYRPDAAEPGPLAEARLASIRQQVAATFPTGWDGPQPSIEANLVRAEQATGGE